jgi:hypothetical protein
MAAPWWRRRTDSQAASDFLGEVMQARESLFPCIAFVAAYRIGARHLPDATGLRAIPQPRAPVDTQLP